MGLWVLECDGTARFEAGATAVVARMPVAGELLLATTPAMAFHCFTEGCSFPESACFRREAEDRVRLVDCRDGVAMPANQLARPGRPPPGPETVIVVVGDRPLIAEPVAGTAAGGGLPPGQVSRLEPCCGGDGRTSSVPAQVAVVTHSGGETPAHAAGATLPATRAGGASLPRYVIDVPPPPLTPDCGVAEALATEARRRDEAGNDAVLRGDLQRAIDEYRAALTLDACNPYAWADLGAVALQVGMTAEAAMALAQAVDLQPRHYTAYTNLGLAYEALGQDALAADAFRAALSLRPHHGPAEEGLRRLEARGSRHR